MITSYAFITCRTFIANDYTFAGLSKASIDQFCGDQLGSIGRQQAQDPSRHDALAAQIKNNIISNSEDWKISTGIAKLQDVMQEIVFNKVEHCSMQRVYLMGIGHIGEHVSGSAAW